jgi:hypothetical protein
MNALDKYDTWELAELPANKKVVGFNWAFTIKHTPDGRIDIYIRVDYDETFAPVAKMSIVKTLISIAAKNLLY